MRKDSGLFEELKAEWSKKPGCLRKRGNLLDQLKVELLKFSYLRTGKTAPDGEALILSEGV